MVTGESPYTSMNLPPSGERPREPRNRSSAKSGIEIQQRLVTYRNAKPLDAAYYTRVVREAPARAVDMLLYKDMLRDDEGLLLIEQALPELLKAYDTLDQEIRARIDGRVARVGPNQKNKTFVNEILREVGRIIRHMPPISQTTQR